ncbi:MAG: alpha/beta fold hydrolase [Elusimicrobia bacterium]|nr:alpha/beta fold hydrolase [Elusimicrobiota bacterium]
MSWLIIPTVCLMAAAVLWKYSSLILVPEILSSVNLPFMFGLVYEKVSFRAADGARLSGWWIPARSGVSDKTIVCCHGWGTNSGDVLPFTWYLADEGFNLFYFDFRGCGESPRHGLSSLGFYETRDFSAALQWLRTTHPERCRFLGVYALSMGAVVGLNAASRPEGRTIAAIAAEAPFLSFRRTLSRYIGFHYGLPAFPFAWLYTALLYLRTALADHEGASPVNTARRFKASALLLIYGDRDYLAWPSDGRAIERIVNQQMPGKARLWLVPGADHAECFDRMPQVYRQKLTAFFKAALPVSAVSP